MTSRRKLYWKILLVALFASLAATGCKNIQPGALTGVWIITNDSRDFLPKDLRNAQATLVLNLDGTFSASNVPAFLYIPGIHPARLETGSGSWKLTSREGNPQLQLNFTTISNWHGRLPFGTQLYVASGISAPSLSYFIGDPDQGRRISLTKH